MKRIAIVTVGVLVLGASTAAAQEATQGAAQDTVQTVRNLYAAAAYEDALAAVKRMQAERPQREVEQYRLFSLFALGRTDEAQTAMEALISSDPAYVLDPVETPPRVHQAFSETRLRLLPDVARSMYLRARAALDRKERAQAIEGFERLLALIDDAGSASPSLDELRILASGFLDLSRTLQAPPPAAPAAAAVVPRVESRATAQPPAGADAPPADARPVAIRQDLPPWVPGDSFSRRTTYSGSVRVLVGPDGRVLSATLVRSIHPSYDPGLLQAARNWVYEPARLKGAAVEAEITVEVNLRPPQ